MPNKIDKSFGDEKDNKDESITNAGLSGAAYETVQRYGSANKEINVGYSGIDNETGQEFSKSLKSISESKINPDYKDNNIHQQAGFSAEVLSNSRKNAEEIIDGKTIRHTRTDDIEKQSYGTKEIGGKNDQLYDHVELDLNGKPIEGTATQMKFVGRGGNDSLKKITSKDFQKYFDNDVPIEVPSDYYDSIKKAADEEIIKTKKQIVVLKEKKPDEISLIEEKQKQLKKLEDIRDGKSIKKSNVSSKEAINARLHPGLTTTKDIVKISHRAGVQQAGYGTAFGGSTSIIRNFVAVVKGDKEAEDAVVEVIKDTGSSAAVSYATAFSGSAIKGAMQNAKSEVVRGLSKTNLPAMLVTLTIETGKTLAKFINGDIDGVQCLEELGEKGTSMAASALFSVIGQIAIPIPVIGGMIGGMIGYALSSACYSNLTSALKNAKLARERRIQIEKECEEAIKMIKQYRAEMEIAISEYLSDHIITFNNAFNEIETSLKNGNIDGFINGANTITSKLGGKPQFNNVSEFDELMKDSDSKLIL